MKLVCRLVLTMILWSAQCGCSVFGQQVITPDQAKQAVRNFEGVPNLQFDSVTLDTDNDPRWIDGTEYSLELHTPVRDWSVDAFTGEVTMVLYMDKYPESQDEPFGTLSQDDCETIALNYVHSKYAGFDNMNFQLKTPEWKGDGWNFKWIQKLAYDALTMNGVDVDVNPESGEIQSYSSCRAPVTAPHQPQLTTQQAIDAAAQALGITSSVEVQQGPTLLADPQGGVYWVVEIGGLGSQGNFIGGSVILNAETGAVYDQAIATGLAPRKNRSLAPPVRAGKMLPIREVVSQIPTSSVQWLGKDGAAVFIGCKKVIVKPGDATVRGGSEQRKLSKKPKLDKGRLMVSGDLLDIVKAVVGIHPDRGPAPGN